MANTARQIGAEFGNSLLGKNQKAILKIVDERTAAGGTSGGAPKVLNAASAVLSGVAAAVSGAAGSIKTFSVQFNPSTLNIYSHSTPVVIKSLSEHNAVEIPKQITKTASSTLSVSLIFDQVNLHDAFRSERAALTSQSAGMLAAEKITGKTFSVRSQINGLLAATMDPGLKQVTFAWSTFQFTGMLSEISAKYTMFSTSGEPIRGTVDLRIEENHASVDVSENEKLFEKLFERTHF